MPDRKTALITGASFGIGLELARIFARESYNLVLVARSADKLRQVASELEKAHGTRSLILAADLSEPGASAYVLDQTTRPAIQVDVLVNNAGFGQYGMFAENDLEECLRQIQLNVTTLTHLTRLYLPAMIERNNGKILNVASTAAFQPGPLMAVYYATKAYVLHFSEATTVAEDGYRALMAGKPVVISGFKNWLLAQSLRFAPRRLVTAVARKIQEK
jgi:short-subunit dehydrogenase